MPQVLTNNLSPLVLVMMFCQSQAIIQPYAGLDLCR